MIRVPNRSDMLDSETRATSGALQRGYVGHGRHPAPRTDRLAGRALLGKPRRVGDGGYRPTPGALPPTLAKIKKDLNSIAAAEWLHPRRRRCLTWDDDHPLLFVCAPRDETEGVVTMPPKRRGLAAARRAAGHSQEKLAEQLDVDRSTIQRWE